MTGGAYPDKYSMPQVMLQSVLTAGSHLDSPKSYTFIYQSQVTLITQKSIAQSIIWKSLRRVIRTGNLSLNLLCSASVISLKYNIPLHIKNGCHSVQLLDYFSQAKIPVHFV